MGGPENGNFPLRYVVKMSLRRWVGCSKNLKIPLRNIKMAPNNYSILYLREICQFLVDTFSLDRVWSRDNSAHDIRFIIKWPANSPDLRLVGCFLS